MKLTYKIGTGIASAAILVSAFAPAILATDGGTIDITNNGADSTNKVKIQNNCTVSVNQTNISTVGVDATVRANTGGNTASQNTGSGVSIDTGNATASATITVAGSTNDATVPSCCECQSTPSAILIDNNGAGSTNKVKETTTNSQIVGQTNVSTVGVKAKVKAKTGKNKAKKNTGGTTDITTGNASSTLGVIVNAPSNSL